MLRLIFLDIDGVIESTRKRSHVDAVKLARLVKLVQETESKVVLSSHWRLLQPLHSRLQAVLRYSGVEVIGHTTTLAPHKPRRPLEICEWILAYNSHALELGRPLVSQYVVVDDRRLLQEEGGQYLAGRFVRTEPHIGLTDADAERMATILLAAPKEDSPPIPGRSTTAELAKEEAGPTVAFGEFGEIRLELTLPREHVAMAPLTSQSDSLKSQSDGGDSFKQPDGLLPSAASPDAQQASDTASTLSLRVHTCSLHFKDAYNGTKIVCGDGSSGRRPSPWIVAVPSSQRGSSNKSLTRSSKVDGSVALPTAETCARLGGVTLDGTILGRGAFGMYACNQTLLCLWMGSDLPAATGRGVPRLPATSFPKSTQPASSTRHALLLA